MVEVQCSLPFGLLGGGALGRREGRTRDADKVFDVCVDEEQSAFRDLILRLEDSSGSFLPFAGDTADCGAKAGRATTCVSSAETDMST
jgi:hypothetical protein